MKEIHDYHTQVDKVLIKHCKRITNPLQKKYENVENVDKLAAAQQNVDDVKLVM